jgi:type II secretory pathway pseudopilin PulG
MILFTRKSEAGYTLLEIGLALGILCLVFAAVMPATGSFLKERRLRAEANRILDLVAHTRLEAKSTGRERKLVFNGTKVALGEDHQVALSPEIRILIRRSESKWEEGRGQDWRFAASGLVEPVALRLELRESWLEMEFDVLTAMVARERYSF